MTPGGVKLQESHKMLKALLFFLLFWHTQMRMCGGVSVLDLNSVKSSDFELMGCAGKLNECSRMGGEEMMMMDSESNRRVLLMQKKYISYGTLKRDLVPCNTPGASYYNCRTPGEANTYNRGCEVITRCARDVSDINS